MDELGLTAQKTRLGLAALFVLAAGHSGFWLWGASSLSRAYHDALQNAGGYWAAREIYSGWPVNPVLTAYQPSLSIAGVNWTGEQLTLRGDILRPGNVTLDLIGPQRIWMQDGPSIAVHAERLWANSSTAPHLQGVNVVIETEGQKVKLGKMDAAWEADSVLITADKFVLRSLPAGRAKLRVSLTPTMPPGATLEGRITAWKSAGTPVTTQIFEAGWQPPLLAASLTAVPDITGRPALSGTVQVRGALEAVETLAATGVVTPSTAQAVRGVLAVYANAVPHEQTAIPFNLRGGVLSAAGIPLLRMPGWPG